MKRVLLPTLVIGILLLSACGTPTKTTDTQLQTNNRSIPRTATCVVAASNASANSKAQADYVCDGSDDQREIQAAINAAAGTVPVFLPPGEYYITSALILPDYTTITGAGKHHTTLKCDSNGIKRKSLDNSETWLTIKDMSIKHLAIGSNTNKGIDFTGVSYSLIENVRIEWFQTGIFLSRGTSAQPCWFNRVTETDIIYTKVAIDLDDSIGFSPNSNVFDDIHVEANVRWHDSIGLEVSGYGHQFSDIYLGMTGGKAAVCFTESKWYQCVAGNNLFKGLFVNSLVPSSRVEIYFIYTLCKKSGKTPSRYADCHFLDKISSLLISEVNIGLSLIIILFGL